MILETRIVRRADGSIDRSHYERIAIAERRGATRQFLAALARSIFQRDAASDADIDSGRCSTYLRARVRDPLPSAGE
jgi:hypothetical protein